MLLMSLGERYGAPGGSRDGGQFIVVLHIFGGLRLGVGTVRVFFVVIVVVVR